MQVTVRLFAQLRERAGTSELSIELPEGARVKDAIDELGDLAAELPVVMAVNREYADGEAPLAAGDELALGWNRNSRMSEVEYVNGLPFTSN